ncbi:MAG: hypothetical protein Q9209_003656 [Squamulea sp. 1 TL-2023]
MPCLKLFVAGLNTGYGAFDVEYVASRAYGTSYGSNGNHNSGHYPQQKRTGSSRMNWGSRITSVKSKGADSNLDQRPKSTVSGAVLRDGAKPQRPTADDHTGVGNVSTLRHHPQRQQFSHFDAAVGLDPRVGAGQEEPGEGPGKGMTSTTSVVARDGKNSIGSDDSQQMIIRKDVTWAVEYSGPDSPAR